MVKGENASTPILVGTDELLQPRKPMRRDVVPDKPH
jgi:hypothetical protein